MTKHTPTPEQRARDLLGRLGMPNAWKLSTGDVIELANLLASHDELVAICERLDVWMARGSSRHGNDALVSIIVDARAILAKAKPDISPASP